MIKGKSISEPKVVVMTLDIWLVLYREMGFPGGSAGKKSTCSDGDLGLIPTSAEGLSQDESFSGPA